MTEDEIASTRGGDQMAGREHGWRRRAGLGFATALGAVLLGAPAIAGPETLAGFHFATTTEHVNLPDLKADDARLAIDFRVLDASSRSMTVEYGTVITRANGTTARRVTSDVWIPLSNVTLTHPPGSGLHFDCTTGEQCIDWKHKEFVDDTGHVLPPQGQTGTFGFALDDAASSTVLKALCPVTNCAAAR
jgi:hypothetical protein